MKGTEWVKVDHPQEKRWNRYFSSGSSGGRLCASVVIIDSDTGAREYSDLGNWYMGNILSARALTVLKVRRDLVNNKFRYNTYFLMFFLHKCCSLPC